MEIKFDEKSWEEFLKKLSSYEGTVANYYKENGITKAQFYYYKKKFNEKPSTLFHAIPVKHTASVAATDKNTLPQSPTIKIEVGKANIFIPSDNVVLLSTVIKELLESC